MAEQKDELAIFSLSLIPSLKFDHDCLCYYSPLIQLFLGEML